MLAATVPAALALVTRIAADRGVSTPSVRFVQGMLPEIERKLSVKGRTEAYITRDQIAEHTGLSASSVIPEYYPRQLAEVGIVHLARKGCFGLVEIAKDIWRGKSSGWIAEPDAYTPKDIPDLVLEAEDYVLDIDRKAVLASLAPTTSDWAKNPEAHRLVLALIHHVGLRRVKVDYKAAAQILGKCRSTGSRVLKRLEQLGFYRDGWVDIGVLLVDHTAVVTEQEHAESVRLAKVRRWSVFTKEGLEVQGYAKAWMETCRGMREEDVRPEFWTGLTNRLTRAVDYVRRVLAEPNSTGRRVEI